MNTPIFYPSEFPHNVPPLEHFPLEQPSSFHRALFIFARCFRAVECGVDSPRLIQIGVIDI